MARFLLFTFLFHSTFLFSQEDVALEKRVHQLSSELRCLVCQNQTLADSNAPLAVDLRNQVREQLKSGRSERDVVEFLTARYGDFVLYRPPLKASTVLLWTGPFLLLALRSRERALRVAATIVPSLVAMAATMAYQAAALGSPLRSGYQFWCPVPYDYPGLTFSLRHVPANLIHTVGASGVLPLGALVLLGRMRRPVEHGQRALLRFLIAGTGPAAAFHLVYFFPEARFLLPAAALLLAACVAAFGGAPAVGQSGKPDAFIGTWLIEPAHYDPWVDGAADALVDQFQHRSPVIEGFTTKTRRSRRSSFRPMGGQFFFVAFVSSW